MECQEKLLRFIDAKINYFTLKFNFPLFGKWNLDSWLNWAPQDFDMLHFSLKKLFLALSEKLKGKMQICVFWKVFPFRFLLVGIWHAIKIDGMWWQLSIPNRSISHLNLLDLFYHWKSQRCLKSKGKITNPIINWVIVHFCLTGLNSVQLCSMWFSMVQRNSSWFNIIHHGSTGFNMAKNDSTGFNEVQYGSTYFNRA